MSVVVLLMYVGWYWSLMALGRCGTGAVDDVCCINVGDVCCTVDVCWLVLVVDCTRYWNLVMSVRVDV
jgi:hypothetical protein